MEICVILLEVSSKMQQKRDRVTLQSLLFKALTEI